MSTEQIHDEVITLLLAGSETIAICMAWLFHELGRAPAMEAALHRELDTVLAGRPVTADDLPPEMTGGTHTVSSTEAATELFKLPAEGVNFEDVERSLIMQAMERTDNNITKSAKLLGLTFRTLQYRLEKFGIKRDENSDEGQVTSDE